MGRVSKKDIKTIVGFIDSLPEEQVSKCSICRETLTHIVTSAQAKTGVGIATITKKLADTLNENAAPQDTVTPRALEERVRRNNGSSPIPTKRGNRNEDETQCEQIERNTPAIDHHDLTPGKAMSDITSGREKFVNGLRNLGRLAQDEKLTSAQYHDQVQNDLQLIIHEAAEIRIYIEPIQEPGHTAEQSPRYRTEHSSLIETTESVGALAGRGSR